MSIAALQGKTVWNSTPEELGLTADQLQAEQKWLKDFNESGDKLNWEAWKDFWTDDAFFTWGHKVRVEGKSAMSEHFGKVLPPFESPGSHEAIRGDPEAKTYTTPTMIIIHKKIGESKLSGMEAYSDMSEVQEKLKAVFSKAA
ncbi:hypothetical protein FRC09_006073 [Ceratobasidium sp. 395]|nr:hypothetical protein FRC09_006073 [Ceratobasidium sp. 395]